LDHLSQSGFGAGSQLVYDRAQELSQTVKNQKFFNISSKRKIVNHISTMSLDLSRGRFINAVGTSSRLIVGPKGMGKSTVLKDLVLTLNEIDDKVLYERVECIANENLVSPCAIIQNLLKTRLDIDINFHEKITHAIEYLEKHNLYVCLIYDELDQLYRCTESRKEIASDILRQIAAVASNDRGRILQIACGSSAVLPLLITKRAIHNPTLVAEFPVVLLSLSLNGSKFMKIRVNGFIDEDEYQDILTYYLQFTKYLAKASPALTNLFYYCLGMNLRKIENICDETRRGGYRDELNAPHDVDSRRIIDEIEELRIKLFDKLVDKNKKLVSKINGDNDTETIQKTNWFKEIIPMEMSEAEKVLEDINQKRAQERLSSLGYEDGVLRLCDTNWFITDSDGRIYPQAPIFIMEHAYPSKSQKMIRYVTTELGPTIIRESAKILAEKALEKSIDFLSKIPPQ